MTDRTDREIAIAHLAYSDRQAQSVAIVVLEAEHESGRVTGILDLDHVLKVMGTTSFSAGIEIGLRAAMLEPRSVERIRDALAELYVIAGDDDGGARAMALQRAQNYLDECLRGMSPGE